MSLKWKHTSFPNPASCHHHQLCFLLSNRAVTLTRCMSLESALFSMLHRNWGICSCIVTEMIPHWSPFCFHPTHVVAPLSFSVFTPITALQVWVMEACQAKKRPGSFSLCQTIWGGVAFYSGIQERAPVSRLAPAKGPIQSTLFAHACHSWVHHHGNRRVGALNSV